MTHIALRLSIVVCSVLSLPMALGAQAFEDGTTLPQTKVSYGTYGHLNAR